MPTRSTGSTRSEGWRDVETRDRVRELELQHAYNRGFIDAMRQLARQRPDPAWLREDQTGET